MLEGLRVDEERLCWGLGKTSSRADNNNNNSTGEPLISTSKLHLQSSSSSLHHHVLSKFELVGITGVTLAANNAKSAIETSERLLHSGHGPFAFKRSCVEVTKRVDHALRVALVEERRVGVLEDFMLVGGWFGGWLVGGGGGGGGGWLVVVL